MTIIYLLILVYYLTIISHLINDLLNGLHAIKAREYMM